MDLYPHRRNLKRHKAPLSIPVTPETEVDCVEVKIPALVKLLASGPAYRLQVRTPSVTAMFLTPEPQSVAERLREYLHTARLSA